MLNQRCIQIYGAVAFSALIGLLAATPAHAQRGLGLGLVPMRTEIRMALGQEYSGSMKLSNSGDKARVRSEVLDFHLDANDTPQFEQQLAGEEDFSCKKWLTINPMEVELNSNGSASVRYTFHLPADLPEGSYNCGAGFTTLPTADQPKQGMGMQMAVRIVEAFYIVIGAPPVKGELKQVTLEPLPVTQDNPTPAWQSVVVLSNEGKMYFRPAGKLDVLDDSGKVVESEPFPSLAVLRQRDQRFVFPLKTNFGTGHYTLRARVDIGTGEIQEGTADVQPPSAHQL